MYWQEDTEDQQFEIPRDVVDLQFRIRCPTLPVDHAWPLFQGIQQHLPWFGSEEDSGLHLIHGADSGNGWERPQGATDLLHLSRRTRLTLRLPEHRLEQAHSLSGKSLEVTGHLMEIGESKVRPLSRSNFLYSRYLVADEPDLEEEAFIEWSVAQLKQMQLKFKKVLCGKQSDFRTPVGLVITRSLMVADLPYEDAVKLQQHGIGPLRHMGCGLFIPQKSF
ncbi:MAG: type I-MYXAN CRISPR-associated protein Cas6/Cmx6 [Gammaproteobacteria bacterium]|nr:type I-MYXAN CRISPR-associated protein Cas6/Cmx6 [Gammaproteobacteria bacterium]